MDDQENRSEKGYSVGDKQDIISPETLLTAEPEQTSFGKLVGFDNHKIGRKETVRNT